MGSSQSQKAPPAPVSGDTGFVGDVGDIEGIPGRNIASAASESGVTVTKKEPHLQWAVKEQKMSPREGVITEEKSIEGCVAHFPAQADGLPEKSRLALQQSQLHSKHMKSAQESLKDGNTNFLTRKVGIEPSAVVIDSCFCALTP
jgi:hypothetical protein